MRDPESVSRARVLEDKSWFAWAAVAAVAAKYGQIQLWNPVGSGVRVLVNRVTFSVSGSSIVKVGWHNAALPDAQSVAARKMPTGGAGNANALVYTTTNAALQYQQFFHIREILAYSPHTIEYRRPVILSPGFGLMVLCEALNQYIDADFDFDEETA